MQSSAPQSADMLEIPLQDGERPPVDCFRGQPRFTGCGQEDAIRVALSNEGFMQGVVSGSRRRRWVLLTGSAAFRAQ